MAQTLHIQTRVLPGHRSEVEAPNLAAGEAVGVTVTATPAQQPAPVPQPQSMLEIVNSLNGYRQFENAEEGDEYIRTERDSRER